MRKYIIILLFFFTTFYTTLSFGQTLKLLPKNELYKDSSLCAFVCRLQYAITTKDKNYLLSVTDPKIKNSFGGDDGIEEFKQIWHLDSTESPIWLLLSKLISLGGTFENDVSDKLSAKRFIFPYVFSMDLQNDTLSYFSIMAVTAENVNVREKPDRNAKVVGKLNYDIVTVDDEKSYPPYSKNNPSHSLYFGYTDWYYITTLDNKISGYVYWDYVWSPVGYRMFLNKINNEWKIIYLIAGD